jgi:type I restriction enzyme S subunit
METKVLRLGDCVLCNPTVKLVKGNVYPVIDIDKITVGRKFVTNKDVIVYDGQGGAKFECGDTLIARITPCLENGKMAKAQIEGQGIGSTELFVFRGKEGISDNDFVYYLFKQQYIRDLAANSMTGASGRQRADLKFIKKIKLDLPSLDSQRRIASILSAYDNLIENNTRRIRLLEQMAENLYKEWFVRFRFPGHEKVEFENGLPKGWKEEKLSNEFTTSSGGTPSRGNTDYYLGIIPWIKTGELLGTFILDTEEHITEDAVNNSSAKIISPYSLLIAMYAGTNVGNMGINTMKATCNQACCVIESRGNYSLYYLKLFLQTQKSFLQSISFGAAQQNISQDIIKKLKVIYPTKDLCDKFHNRVSIIYKDVEYIMRQNQNLTRQRDLLLPRLMSGKLEVKVKE